MEFLTNNLDVVLTAIIALLGSFGVVKVKLDKLKKEIVEATQKGVEAGKKIKEFRSEKSDGGKKLTPAEISEAMPLLFDALSEFTDVLKEIQAIAKAKKSSS